MKSIRFVDPHVPPAAVAAFRRIEISLRDKEMSREKFIDSHRQRPVADHDQQTNTYRIHTVPDHVSYVHINYPEGRLESVCVPGTW
jgi:hypothetical protein